MTVTLPTDGGGGTGGLWIPDVWLPIIGAVVVAVFTLFGGFVLALYKSSPPAVQGVISVVINFLLKAYEAKSKITPNTADDDRAGKIRQLLTEQGYLDEADFFDRLLSGGHPNEIPDAVG